MLAGPTSAQMKKPLTFSLQLLGARVDLLPFKWRASLLPSLPLARSSLFWAETAHMLAPMNSVESWSWKCLKYETTNEPKSHIYMTRTKNSWLEKQSLI
ncbi:hypothetical protein RchiOBHm_Chr2g0104881 [Rosa chinensis]|uniref:Uncharacterized protein n=1 Tax=Rosa chinensis TaxID=74649 RepID=A0A2P6RNA3_ROSCH|nr:hypothetical protein RchiOBHm_Chr2g0104881 [Rosa chinensis]